jgi:O-antigen/teichoic acid export membrane protein
MQLRGLRPTMILMLGQALAMGVSFFVPMVLARQLSTEDFGIYRLIMMLQVLLTIIGSVGFDGGLFRHVRSEEFTASFQGTLSLIWGIMCGTVVAGFVVLLAPLLGSLLSAPDLARYSWHLALLILFAMPTAHLEHFCIANNRPGLSAAIVSLHAFGCALATIIAILTVGTVSAILSSLVLWFTFRCFALSVFYIVKIRKVNYPLRVWWEKGVHHFRFGLPIGGNNLLLAIGRFDRFLVSALFGVAGFARYSVGCLELPLARQWIETSQNLASVRAVDRARSNSNTNDYSNLKLWLKDCSYIWLYLFPAVAIALIFAPELLTVIFGEVYSNSASIFRVFLIGVLCSAFDPELFLRATDRAFVSTVTNLFALALFAALAFGFYRANYLSLEGLMALRVATDALSSASKYVSILYLGNKKKPLQLKPEGASLILN